MPDSEIVKAFKICNDLDEVGFCKDCPHEGVERCIQYTNQKILDLINRLKVDKEYYKKNRDKYQENVMFLSKQCDELQAENERLKKSNEMFTNIGKMYSEIKAEAYKEFAELLHCQCESIINQPHNENVRPISWKVAYEEFDDKVDNLLKELVGDNETVL